MNGETELKLNEPQAVVMDERLDVRHRLRQLQDWQQTWQQEDKLLEQRAMQLEGNSPLDIQKGAQIASLRRRLRLNLVKAPLEIDPVLVEQSSYRVLRRCLTQQFVTLTQEERRRLLEVSNLCPGVPIICASCHPFKWVEGDLEIAGRWNDYFGLRQYTGQRLRQLLAYLELLLPFTQPSSLLLAKGEGAVDLIEKWTGGILRDIMLLILDASTRAIKQGLSHLSPGLLAATWQDLQTHQVTNFLKISQRNGGER